MNERVAVALTSENIEEDNGLWKRVDAGEFAIVYASPEILLEPRGPFMKKIVTNPKSPFMRRLTAMTIDECHSLNDASVYRPAGMEIGILRDLLHVPIAGFTATVTPLCIEKYKKLANVFNPTIIRRSIRKRNLRIWVAPMEDENTFSDLDILIPKNCQTAGNIPQGFIFIDNTINCNVVAQYLRTKLSSALQSNGRIIIRAYHSALDQASRDKTTALLKSGDCRLCICTGAMAMGVDFRHISLVVQYGLDSRVNIRDIYQRFGRAGREPSEEMLALIFVTKANLNAAEKLFIPVQQAGQSPNQSQSEINAYTVPVTEENSDLVESFLPRMYEDVNRNSKGALIKRSQRKLAPGIHWMIQTTGSRHRVLLSVFRDAEVFKTTPHDCDNDELNYLIETEQLNNPPVVFGIPFTITLAYKEYLKKQIDLSGEKERRPRKTMRQKLNPAQSEYVEKALQKWRERIFNTHFGDQPGLTPGMVLGKSEIAEIKKSIRADYTLDELRDALIRCKHQFPGSVLTPHIDDLHLTIALSIIEARTLIKPALSKQVITASQSASNQRTRMTGFIPPPQINVPMLPYLSSTSQSPSSLFTSPPEVMIPKSSQYPTIPSNLELVRRAPIPSPSARDPLGEISVNQNAEWMNRSNHQSLDEATVEVPKRFVIKIPVKRILAEQEKENGKELIRNKKR